MLIGHSQGLEVYSPSLGLSPAFPVSMTMCDSTNLWMKLGANCWKLTLGSLGKKLSSTFQLAIGSLTFGLQVISCCSKPHFGSCFVVVVSTHLRK